MNTFAYTSRNRFGVGAIDNPDQFKQLFDTYYIPEASEKIFIVDISVARPSKTSVFGGYKSFISNFPYYHLY